MNFYGTSALAALLLLTQANASQASVMASVTPPPPAAVDSVNPPDPHPYQNQSLMRLSGTILQTINSIAFDYTPPGAGATTFKSTQILNDNKIEFGATDVMGSNYIFFDKNMLGTVDQSGVFYSPTKPVTFQHDVLGGVYFTKKGTQEIVAVDSFGNYFETGDIAGPIRLAGGNFYIGQDNKLTAIKSMGSFFKGTDGKTYRSSQNMIWHSQATYPDALTAGGNYFMNSTGEVVTVTSEKGFNGAVKTDSRPELFGGNYFIGKDHLLYTVSNAGGITKNEKITVIAPNALGYSYYIAADGTVTTIDAFGTPHSGVVRVSEPGSKISLMNRAADGFEKAAVYLPKK